MNPVQAGEFRHRIRILRRAAKADGEGFPVGEPEEVYRCWARVTMTSGTELVRANADFGQMKARFLIRWTSVPIDRKMWAEYGGKEWQIEYVNDYAGRQYLELWGVCESNSRS